MANLYQDSDGVGGGEWRKKRMKVNIRFREKKEKQQQPKKKINFCWTKIKLFWWLSIWQGVRKKNRGERRGSKSWKEGIVLNEDRCAQNSLVKVYQNDEVESACILVWKVISNCFFFEIFENNIEIPFLLSSLPSKHLFKKCWACTSYRYEIVSVNYQTREALGGWWENGISFGLIYVPCHKYHTLSFSFSFFSQTI